MTSPLPPRSNRRFRRLVAALAILGALAILSAAILLRPKPFRLPPVPDPNGYDLLVRAGRMIGPPPNEGDILAADPAELREWVDEHRDALNLASDGLALPSAVPLSGSEFDSQRSIGDSGPLRLLALLILADAVASHDQGDLPTAVRRAIDGLHLGRDSGSGGLIMHRMTGAAIERAAGFESIRRIREDLDESQCRLLIDALLELDASVPDPDETIALDLAVGRASLPTAVNFSRTLIPGVEAKLQALAAPAYSSFLTMVESSSAERRLLATDLAIRAYRLRHDGDLPTHLTDLVPEFLPSVPLSPFTGEPPYYEPDPDGDGFLLLFLGSEDDDLEPDSQ